MLLKAPLLFCSFYTNFLAFLFLYFLGCCGKVCVVTKQSFSMKIVSFFLSKLFFFCCLTSFCFSLYAAQQGVPSASDSAMAKTGKFYEQLVNVKPEKTPLIDADNEFFHMEDFVDFVKEQLPKNEEEVFKEFLKFSKSTEAYAGYKMVGNYAETLLNKVNTLSQEKTNLTALCTSLKEKLSKTTETLKFEKENNLLLTEEKKKYEDEVFSLRSKILCLDGNIASLKKEKKEAERAFRSTVEGKLLTGVGMVKKEVVDLMSPVLQGATRIDLLCSAFFSLPNVVRLIGFPISSYGSWALILFIIRRERRLAEGKEGFFSCWEKMSQTRKRVLVVGGLGLSSLFLMSCVGSFVAWKSLKDQLFR